MLTKFGMGCIFDTEMMIRQEAQKLFIETDTIFCGRYFFWGIPKSLPDQGFPSFFMGAL